MRPEHLSSIFSTTWTSIAPAVGNHLWQSTLFAVAAGVLTLVLRKNQARIRYAIWLAASVKFLLPFSWLVVIGSYMAWRHAVAPATAGFFMTSERCEPALFPIGNRDARDFCGHTRVHLAQPYSSASGNAHGYVALRIRGSRFVMVRALAAGCRRHARGGANA